MKVTQVVVEPLVHWDKSAEGLMMGNEHLMGLLVRGLNDMTPRARALTMSL